MARTLFLLSVLGLTAMAQPAPTPDATTLLTDSELHAKVDELFESYDSTISPGCAVAVINDGQVVYKRGYGMANLDHDIPIRPETVFHVASISKQFTAAAIVLLAQEGKLKLDDEVRKYVPELPDFGVPISIRHLIHHTSGLRDQWSLLGLAGWRYALDLITDQDVLDVMSAQKELNFKPGEKHTYSNTGYTLLAQIVKRVSGKSLRDFTVERIFRPLGMNDTHFRDDHAEIVKQMAYGYERGKGEGEFKLSITNFDTAGATSLLTTVEDLARWDQNFYEPKVGGTALIQQMLQRGKLDSGKVLDYASGLVHGTYRGATTIDHGGADAGYRADLLRFPDHRFSAACLCNLAQTNPGTLTRAIADIYLAGALKEPKRAPAANATSTVVLTPRQLAQFAGLYWNQEEESGWKVALEDTKLSLLLGPDQSYEMQPLAASRFRLAGPPIEIEFRRGSTDDPLTLVAKADGSSEERVLEAATEFEPTRAELSDYVGVYRSDELEPVYRIGVQDGALILKRLKHQPDKLAPMITDYFGSSIGSIHFMRGSSGQVAGFVLNAGRIRGLKFKRSTTR